MATNGNHQTEPQKPVVPSDGYIIMSEAYPEDDEFIAIHLMYYESETDIEAKAHKNRRFLVKKDDAMLLAKGIIDILNAASTQEAWENIAKEVDCHGCDDLNGLDESKSASS
jgi:hypothetical protein